MDRVIGKQERCTANSNSNVVRNGLKELKYNESKCTQIINKNRLREKLLSLLFDRMRETGTHMHYTQTYFKCIRASARDRQHATLFFKSHAQRP